jgi:hypothetical protein
MLRLKQTSFPVLFLTQGEKGDWPQFFDVRTWSINIGLCFIVSEHLTGLAAPALDILSNKEFVKHCKDNGKLLFIWGDEAGKIIFEKQKKNMFEILIKVIKKYQNVY